MQFKKVNHKLSCCLSDVLSRIPNPVCVLAFTQKVIAQMGQASMMALEIVRGKGNYNDAEGIVIFLLVVSNQLPHSLKI